MKNKKVKILACAFCSVLMVGLFFLFPWQETNVDSAYSAVDIKDEAVPLYDKPVAPKVLTPVASGATVYESNQVVLDASNSAQGYVMINYKGNNGKIKVQVTKSGNETYTYNLNARKVYEVFPLSEGNGTYTIKVFENISGTQYAQAFSKDITVQLANEFLPFLYPNQYVNYTAGSQTVKTGMSVTKNAKTDVKVVESVYNYVVNGMTYDKAKAASVKSGYLPNVDSVLAAKKGICFDYAAVMATMLRTQNIPTKLVVGYTGDVYHAWINVYLEGSGWVNQMIFFNGSEWKLMDPTFASSGKKSESITKYITNSANYKQKYVY
ncbi:MAG: transglutaminase-like domain-containing protein [Anaerovorax sp.]